LIRCDPLASGRFGGQGKTAFLRRISCPAASLKDARERRDKTRKRLDPGAVKKARKAGTRGQMAGKMGNGSHGKYDQTPIEQTGKA
jgi:hypothetical protein